MIDDILNERSKTHGDFKEQAAIAQGIKALVVINDPVLREAAHMICHKLARIVAGNAREPDHWIDIAGYATLASREIEGRSIEQLIVKGKL